MSVLKKTRPARGSKLTTEEIHTLFSRLREGNPHPTTELEYSSVFELLVAVVLSAQATDVGVNKATRKLFPIANTPAAIFALGEDGLKSYINTIGLYNAKAANVIALCRQLLEQHAGEVPRQREALEALPGVGRKTAKLYSIQHLANPQLQWIRISFVFPTAQGWRRAKMFARWKTNSFVLCLPNLHAMLTTGLFCTAAIPAKRASRIACTAQFTTSAAGLRKDHQAGKTEYQKTASQSPPS